MQMCCPRSISLERVPAREVCFMTANDFRELALGFDDAEESAHMGAADFRVGGRIFATLAHEHLGFGNMMLSPELQQSLIAEAPEVFLPVAGGWGRMGAPHIGEVSGSVVYIYIDILPVPPRLRSPGH